jgi:hypothetical protein
MLAEIGRFRFPREPCRITNAREKRSPTPKLQRGNGLHHETFCQCYAEMDEYDET